MAERTGSPQEENVANESLSLSGSGLSGLPFASEHHPMFGCRDATRLLCSSGLPKC